MFVDYHVHSEFSDDSEYEAEQIVQDAIAMGIKEFCFTDHVDYGIKRDWDDPRGVQYRRGGRGEPEWIPLANVEYERYEKTIRMLQEKYRDQITIRMGMEFGMQCHTIAEYEKLYKSYPFDFIILSVHEVDNRELWNGELRKGLTREEYYRKYYSEMLALVTNYQNYSILGHLDLITRYDEEGIYPFEKIKPYITEILKKVIADGKGIEVNTSCYRYGLAELTPSIQILELYRELGGTILTIGSDSHKKEHLGQYIPETLLQLKSMGFDKICTFENMQPMYHPI